MCGFHPSLQSKEQARLCLQDHRGFTWRPRQRQSCRCGSLFDSRCYCFECVDSLVGPGASGKVQAMSNWVCFLCLPFPRSGLLQRRKKWRGWLKAFCDRESVRTQWVLGRSLDRKSVV